MRAQTLKLVVAMVSLTAVAQAEDWAHWRGPTGNGIAISATPPTEFSPSNNVKWKVQLAGPDHSSPIVWKDKVYITTGLPINGQAGGSVPTFAFKVLCFNRADGKKVWEQTAIEAKPHQGTHQTNGFASASPCTDGERVYASFGSRGLYCYSMNGEFVWKRDDLPPMQTLNSFGEGSSPTLEGNMLLVPWDHIGPSALYALDKLTGKEIWKTPRNDLTCWATPLVVEHNGKKQVVMNGQAVARSYDLETGKELWHCAGQTKRPAATPVAEKGLVFVGSGFQGSFMGAFHLDGRGDIKGTKQVAWTLDHDTPDVASPLLSHGRIYFHKGKSGQLSCVDAATGKPYYLAKRIDGIDSTYSSPVAAGGHIYLTGLNGTIVVIKDSENLEIVSTNPMNETIGATPAPVDNELFVRGAKHLFCLANAK